MHKTGSTTGDNIEKTGKRFKYEENKNLKQNVKEIFDASPERD